MVSNRRALKRPVGDRPYHKLFVIAVEGNKTEQQYFNLFNNPQLIMSQRLILRVKCPKSGHDSAPPQVLNRMKTYLKEEELKSSDEAWLVVDKDQWDCEQLRQLHDWAQSKENYHLALSNPKFEYWLLLHFEDGNGITSAKDCDTRLKKHLPHYDKGIRADKFPREKIEAAISRAQKRDNPPCADWPRSPGVTTVYKLVENILKQPPAKTLDCRSNKFLI